MNKLYVTEPDAINMRIVDDILTDDWEIIEGNTSFDGDDIEDCAALLIRSATTITSTIKRTFPALEHIIRVGVGVDNIDMDYCTREGIAVYNAPGANADAVSDYVIGMMLHALRKTHRLSRQDIEKWDRFKFTGRSMASRRIGIIGFGNIGRQIFYKLQGFNCQAFYIYDPFVKKADMPMGATYVTSVEDVLRQSDIVTLHVPLLPNTKYLINKDNLGLMPDGAILINSSRGGIVREADVVEYMRGHNLVYVADTVEGEPNVSQELLDAADALVTPHIASLTRESDDTMVAVALDNFSRSKPMNKPTHAVRA
jgi:D-3-phosphoglycerate dehydrogenase / 2-oxoglutarate reductase